jgi:hypothetical protein
MSRRIWSGGSLISKHVLLHPLKHRSIVISFPFFISDFDAFLHLSECVSQHFCEVRAHVVYLLLEVLDLFVLLSFNLILLIVELFVLLLQVFYRRFVVFELATQFVDGFRQFLKL